MIDNLFGKNYYIVDSICRNCKKKQETKISKGNKAEDVIGNGKCENCGCKELELSSK